MKQIRLDEQLGYPFLYDIEDKRVFWNQQIPPGYQGERSLSEMKQLYAQKEYTLSDETKMYFTAGGVALPQDAALFHKHHVTYEYTVIPPIHVAGECNKTFGHIHGKHPKTGKSRLEAFEILYGEGCFQLFKEIGENTFLCLLIHLQARDQIIVPGDYFHLSINLSKTEPFVFADLIKDDVETVYSYVKSKNGAPYRLFHASEGNVAYCMNENWKDTRVYLQVMCCDDVPWKQLRADRPLYQAFTSDSDGMTKILEG